MAGKMVRPYSFLMYILAILVGFFVGVMYAGWIDAGKDQMLAAGAILVGYGVVGAFISFVASLALVYWSGRRTIIGLNGILALLLAGFFVYFTVKYQRKQAVNSKHILPETELPGKMTAPKKRLSLEIEHHGITSEVVEFPKAEAPIIQRDAFSNFSTPVANRE